LKKRVMKRSFL